MSNAFHHVERYFWGALSQQQQQINPGLFLYRTGVPYFNSVIVSQIHPQWLADLQQGCHQLITQGLPFNVQVNSALQPQVTPLLLANGLVADAQTAAMQLSLTPLSAPTPLPAELEIRVTDQDLDLWAAPLQSAFGAGPAITAAYQGRHQAALKTGQALQHYTLFCAEHPVCSLTLTRCQHLARLDDIGTDSAYQGKGYATQLIQHVLAQLPAEGIEQCFLEASTEGASLYQRLGFVELFTYQLSLWEPD